MSTNKSFSTETSERYSRALFEVVDDAKELEKTESDIRAFQLLLNSSESLKTLSKINPKHKPTK